MSDESELREQVRQADAVSLFIQREGIEDLLETRRDELMSEFVACGHNEDLKRYWIQQALVLLDMFDKQWGGYILTGAVADQTLIEIINSRAAQPGEQDARGPAAVA